MRFILPVLGAATALRSARRSATAQGHHQPEHRHPPPGAEAGPGTRRAARLSGHSVLTGEGVTVHGKVRPSGGHQVKLVFTGPEKEVVEVHTKAERHLHGALECGRHRQLQRDRLRASHEKLRARLPQPGPQADLASGCAGASYYGPGLYGNGVACGGTLEPGTLGVANKTLPCGTKVKLRYHGRSDHRPGDRPRPLRRRSRVRPDRSDQGRARLPGRRRRDGEPLGGARVRRRRVSRGG